MKTSETVVIKRSQINFAEYNPRKFDKELIKSLKKNFKKVGFMGGIIWNETTGNLVGGHQRTHALDEIYDYPKNDYDIRVEKVILDEKTEKEQNIFLNNRSVQGEWDDEKLKELWPEIDIKEAGFNQEDEQYFTAIWGNEETGSNEDIRHGFNELEKKQKHSKEEIKNLKKSINKEIKDKNLNIHDSYVTLVFENNDNKTYFMERFGLNPDDRFVKAEILMKLIDDI